jgi:hypothetical protein
MKINSRFAEKSKLRATAARILLSVVVLSLFILALEIVLRTTHLFGATTSPSEPCPVLSWRFTPGRKYWRNGENDHPIVGRINSHGWRDKEWSLRKAQGTYRIAVLGDSMVEAFQVESDATFLALAENELKKNHNLNVELMNFGRSGATQTEELLILKNDVEQFSPDMVLLFFWALNDISDVSRETCPSVGRPFYNVSEDGELILDVGFSEMREYKIKCLVNSFKQHSALISLLAQRYNGYQRAKLLRRKKQVPKENGVGMPQEKMERYLSLCTDNPDASYVRSYQLNKTLIKAMSEYCKGRTIRFMIVCANTGTYIQEIEEKHKTIDSTFDANFFEDDLKNYAKVLDAEYLGLQRAFRNSWDSKRIPLHWDHWNYDGHKLVANTLANKLKSVINGNDEE